MFVFLLVIGIFLWSLIFIVIASWQLSNTTAGGTEEGGDNPGATEREEITYELAGSCLGFVSAVFHGIILQKHFHREA